MTRQESAIKQAFGELQNIFEKEFHKSLEYYYMTSRVIFLFNTHRNT